jgi:hypothetical protein
MTSSGHYQRAFVAMSAIDPGKDNCHDEVNVIKSDT